MLSRALFDDSSVLGCGGYIISSEGIDFTKIFVTLHKLDGTLLFSIQCAPTGYFFLPTSSVGQYIIKIHSSNNFLSFIPSEQQVVVTDTCNGGKDLSFTVTGIQLKGVVEGVDEIEKQSLLFKVNSLDLHGNCDISGEVSSVVATKNGSFNFGNIDTGTYCIFLDSQDVIVEPKEIYVSIDFDSGITFSLNNPLKNKDSLNYIDSILFKGVGFSIYGTVDLDTFRGDTSIFTYALFKHESSIDDIYNAVQVVIPVKKEKYGSIVFRNVSSGEYIITAFSKGSETEYHYKLKVFIFPKVASSSSFSPYKISLSPDSVFVRVSRCASYLTSSGEKKDEHAFTISSTSYITKVYDSTGAPLAGVSLRQIRSPSPGLDPYTLSVSDENGVLLYACPRGVVAQSAIVEKNGYLFDKFERLMCVT
jgi:hypothetical protein